MLTQKTNLTNVQLNTATPITILKEIVKIGSGVFRKTRKATTVILDNKSGADIEYAIFNRTELNSWLSNNSLSDFIILGHNIKVSLTNQKIDIAAVIVKGTSSHTGNASVYIITET